MNITLNLTEEEAEALYWELQRQFDGAGRENAQDLVPVEEKLERQLGKIFASPKD